MYKNQTHRKMSVKLSIITVNYNGIFHTLEMLDSLYKTIFGFDFEVIVVDNGSANDETIEIKKAFPHVVVLRSEDNLGFAGGNNLGIENAQGEYLFLLNNDTIIEENGFPFLLERMECDTKIGALSPKLRFAHGDRNVQYAGTMPLSRITLRNSTIGYNEMDAMEYNVPNYTAFAHGAAMLVPRKVIDKVGLMPDMYFMYYEELDWCERIRQAGYEIAYEPRCVIFHKESATTGAKSPLLEYYLVRNRLLFAYRNRNGIERILALAYQLFCVNPPKLIKELFTGKKEYACARYKGLCDFFKMKKY